MNSNSIFPGPDEDFRRGLFERTIPLDIPNRHAVIENEVNYGPALPGVGPFDDPRRALIEQMVPRDAPNRDGYILHQLNFGRGATL